MYIIHYMNIQDLDLGALIAFEAVRRSGSVTIAAEELGLAQPTLSNRLRRLRAALDDPLFIRTSEGMVPTPFAAELGGYVAQALSLIEQGLRQRSTFDESREARTFTIIMTDIAEAILLPPLLERCAVDAPGIKFRTLRMPIRETLGALKSGEIDLAIGFIPELGTGVDQQMLFTSSYVCIASARHPFIGPKIDRETFLRARHAVAEVQGTGHHVIEKILDREGVRRQIDVRVPSFLALPMIVSGSAMIATVPRPLDRILSGAAQLKRLDHPLDLPPIEVKQFWHERFRNDPANKWLRRRLREVFSGIDWGD